MIYRKGFSTSCTSTQIFPLLAHMHRLFHFSLFCSKLFFLTCICVSVSEAETGEGRHAGHYEYEQQPFQELKTFLQRRGRKGSFV